MLKVEPDRLKMSPGSASRVGAIADRLGGCSGMIRPFVGAEISCAATRAHLQARVARVRDLVDTCPTNRLSCPSHGHRKIAVSRKTARAAGSRDPRLHPFRRRAEPFNVCVDSPGSGRRFRAIWPKLSCGPTRVRSALRLSGLPPLPTTSHFLVDSRHWRLGTQHVLCAGPRPVTAVVADDRDALLPRSVGRDGKRICASPLFESEQRNHAESTNEENADP